MKIAKPKLVYSIVAVCAVASASVLAAGVYSDFFTQAGSEPTVQSSTVAPAESDGSAPESINARNHELKELVSNESH